MFININGKLLPEDLATIPHDSRAFRYGHGLFETMLFENGHIALEDLHWSRLFAGMAQLYFEIPGHLTGQHLAEEIKRTVRKNRLEVLCRIRLQVWPGSGGLYDATSYMPHFIIECFPLQKELTELNENGLTVGLARGIAKSMDSLANLKSCNALIYSIAARQAKAGKWNDALLLNTEGRIIESTIANIFWVKTGVIYTPPLSEGCIGGVMRERLMQMLHTKNLPCREVPLSEAMIFEADELFLTNAIRKIKWISRLGDKIYSHHLLKELNSGI